MISNSYHIELLAKITKAKLVVQNPEHQLINDLLIDSRKLINTHHNLFIALLSLRNDGHKYIKILAKKGVYNFLVQYLPENYSSFNANFIIVDDTLKALQQISSYHRRQFHHPVVGITGSNGKTIVKEWTYQCLSPDYSICRSPKSYNSQIGVPLSVFQLSPDNNLGLFEAGVSEPEEMAKLEQIIKPEIGIFTGIGDAHNKNFVDIRQKVNEKLMLFVNSKVLIFGRDYGDIAERIFSVDIFKSKLLLDWSRRNKEAALFISAVTQQNQKSTIEGIWKNQAISYSIPFSDEASIENSISVCLLMLYLKIDIETIKHRMANLSAIAMRMELREGINNCSIINDSYNSDFNALSIAIDFLLQQQQHKKQSVILSDILQSGKNNDELYAQVANLIREKNINRFIGIGPNLKEYKKLFTMESYFYDSTRDFLQYFTFSSFNNETILLKGARKFEFEKINKTLGKKTHLTRLEVNLNAMLDNYNYFRSIIKPKVKTMIMVKAFSYGSGSFEVANLLQFHNADYLAVAYADEGVDLRRAGITLPIMVMNPELDALETIIVQQLEPEIYSFDILNALEKTLQSQAFPQNKPISIHIKLDTGMHRLGFMGNELDSLINRIISNPKIVIKSIFSHLAASDDKHFDTFTNDQLKLFNEYSNKIRSAFNYPILRHIANSAAISRFPSAQYDMVRIGIGLYGIASDTAIQDNLKVVSSLKTNISQIKTIKKGESVGYSRAFIASNDMHIAIIPIGYADGFDRRFSQGKGYVLVNKQRCPVIGNVCMDMCMIDLKNQKVKVGDEVCIFGENIDIKELATTIGSIAYELLTSISSRVKRIYIQE